MRRISKFRVIKIDVNQFPLALFPFLMAFTLGVLRIDTFQVGTYYDDAWYVNTATALARNLGYVRIWTPDLRPETFLPIGYPLILSVIRRVFPHSFEPMLILSLAAFVGGLIFFIAFYRKRFNKALSWFAVLLLSVHVGLLGISTTAMAESSYILLSVVALVLVERDDFSDKSHRQVLLLTLTVTAAYFVRSWGIALVIAVLIYLLKRKCWLAAGFIGVFFVISYTLWSFRNVELGGTGASYGLSVATLETFLEGFSLNFASSSRIQWLFNLPNVFLPILGPQVEAALARYGLNRVLLLIGPGIAFLLSLGYFRVTQKKLTAVEIYIPLYLGILVIAAPDNRYWLPIFPFLLYYLIEGMQVILIRLISKRECRSMVSRGVLVVFVLSLMAVLHFYRDIQAYTQPVRERIPDVAIAGRWLQYNAPQDAVVMALVPRVSYLYSERTTVPFPDGGDGKRYEIYPELRALGGEGARARFFEAIELFEVDYIVIEPQLTAGLPFRWPDYIADTIFPALVESPNFSPMFESDDSLTQIYQVIPE